MKTIPAKLVLEAYEKTGLKPVMGRFWTEDKKCGCALTALFIHASGLSVDEGIEKMEYLDNFSDELCKVVGIESNSPDHFINDFYSGFDFPTYRDEFNSDAQKNGAEIRKIIEEKYGSLE